MGLVVKVIGGVAGVAVLGVAGTAAWGVTTRDARLAATHEAHAIELPVPWPLSEEATEALRKAQAEAQGLELDGTPAGDDAPEAEPVDLLAGVDLDAVALEQAIARGEHLVNARYMCVECHGADGSGGVMVDSGALGTFLGKNLTPGEGSAVADYTVADWDRIVRHGIKPDGTAAIMPSEDFVQMTDQELSDIIAYFQSLDPVANTVPDPTFGPVGTMLLASEAFPLTAEQHPDHQGTHAEIPPPPAVDTTFGKHMANICSGCHRPDFSGGPMLSGDPSWPPAGNLTSHGEGLAGWTYADFETAMREGTRPDGSALKSPMDLIPKYAQRMTDTELEALWVYLQSLPPKPTPKG